MAGECIWKYSYCVFLHLCVWSNKVNVRNLYINLLRLFSSIVFFPAAGSTAEIDPTGTYECAATRLLMTVQHEYMSQTNPIAQLSLTHTAFPTEPTSSKYTAPFTHIALMALWRPLNIHVSVNKSVLLRTAHWKVLWRTKNGIAVKKNLSFRTYIFK